MEIVKHPLCVKVLGAPPDMPEPHCLGLPVYEHKDEWGTWSVSFWKPTKEEIAELLNEGTVALWVRSQDDAHPVVGMAVQPYDEEQTLVQP